MEQGSALQIEDLKDLQEKLFSDKAKKALETKATSVVYLKDDGTGYEAIYLGSRVLSDRIEEGARKVADRVNELAEQGVIHSALSGLIKVDLARMPYKAPTSVVLCYVLVPFEIAKEYREAGKSLKEGSVPECDMNDAVILKDGEFLSAIRIHAGYGIIKTHSTIQELLQREIDQILAIMPRGTIHVSTEKCAITDLSVPFEVKFYNPLMSAVKRVELEYTRTMTKLNESEIKEFNVVTGVRYFDAEDKELFR